MIDRDSYHTGVDRCIDRSRRRVNQSIDVCRDDTRRTRTCGTTTTTTVKMKTRHVGAGVVTAAVAAVAVVASASPVLYETFDGGHMPGWVASEDAKYTGACAMD